MHAGAATILANAKTKRKQGNKDEKKLKFASAMETVSHDEEYESE